MVTNPIIILVELVVGLFRFTFEEIYFLFSKLFEFFYSVNEISGSIVFALITSGIIGTTIFLIVRKRIFGSLWPIVVLAIVLLSLILIAALIVSFISS